MQFTLDFAVTNLPAAPKVWARAEGDVIGICACAQLRSTPPPLARLLQGRDHALPRFPEMCLQKKLGPAGGAALAGEEAAERGEDSSIDQCATHAPARRIGFGFRLGDRALRLVREALQPIRHVQRRVAPWRVTGDQLR